MKQLIEIIVGLVGIILCYSGFMYESIVGMTGLIIVRMWMLYYAKEYHS